MPDVEMDWENRQMQSHPQHRRRAARWVAIVVLTAAVLPAGAGLAAAGDVQPGPCPLTREKGESVRAHSRQLIRCAAERWSVPGGAAVALCIARRESGLIPSAESRDGLNKGLFQQHVDYWKTNFRTYAAPSWRLSPRILNGRTNAVVSIRMASNIGWGPWGGRHCS